MESEGSAMALSEDEVRDLAVYAHIALEPDELIEMTAYLNDAIQVIEPIERYLDEDISPMFHPTGALANVMREDIVDAERALDLDDALENAGAFRDRMFRVPSILGEGGES